MCIGYGHEAGSALSQARRVPHQLAFGLTAGLASGIRELAEAVIGSTFVALGLVAVAAALTARPRRDAAAFWFGVFCVLYGLRLSAGSALVEAVVPWSPAVLQYAAAFVTYTILIPAGLFAESLLGPGRYRLVRRTWQAACVYAVVAIANALAQRNPEASMWLNPPVVLSSLAVLVPHVIGRARGARWPIEARVVAASLVLFIVTAAYETVMLEGFFGPDSDAEPLAMLLFAAALGWFVLAQARERADAFAALSRELQIAREIQQSLLPREMPAASGLRLRGTYLPMSAVAGDFYDVVCRGDRVVIIVADVSGHGVPAALIASMVKVAFAAEVERYDRPGDLLAGINRALTGTFERAYVTACCVSIDRARERLAYAAAGHPPSMLRRRDGRIERLEEGGVALALLPVASYATTDVPFRAGDRLLLFTDGLLEAAPDGGEEFFGDAELERVVAGAAPGSDLRENVLEAHRAWIRGAPLADDVTLVVADCE